MKRNTLNTFITATLIMLLGVSSSAKAMVPENTRITSTSTLTVDGLDPLTATVTVTVGLQRSKPLIALKAGTPDQPNPSSEERLYRKASFSQIRVRSVDHNQPYLGTKIPLSMTILATHTCNLKCIHCSEWQPRKEYLTTERLHILIDELKNEGTVKISLTGGEPLMTKDVDAILDHINNKNFITHLTSNGYLVPKIY